ncbi:hypothetical protein K9L05_00320 [Candidatus Babeliales bacterium]|nr:hypothetical protein [Candidatus Babeliales bacterium]MCF7899079.1 hypothetical protein [Candidatus Babeliales bacterium]
MKNFNKFFIAVIAAITLNFCTNFFVTASVLTEHQEKSLQEQSENFSSKVFDFLKNTEYLSDSPQEELVTQKELIAQFLNLHEQNLKKLFYENFYFYMQQIKVFRNLKSNVANATYNAKILKESTYKFFIGFSKSKKVNDLINIFERNKISLQDRFENISSECLNLLYNDINKSLFARFKEKFSFSKKKTKTEQQTDFVDIQKKIEQINHDSDLDISKNLIKNLLQNINKQINQVDQVLDDNSADLKEFLDMYECVDKLFKSYWMGFEKEVLNNLKKLHSSILKFRVLHDNPDKLPVKKGQFKKLESAIKEYLNIKDMHNRGLRGFVKQIPTQICKGAFGIVKFPVKFATGRVYSALKWSGNIAGTTCVLLAVAGVANIYFKDPNTGVWQAFSMPYKNMFEFLKGFLIFFKKLSAEEAAERAKKSLEECHNATSSSFNQFVWEYPVGLISMIKNAPASVLNKLKSGLSCLGKFYVNVHLSKLAK